MYVKKERIIPDPECCDKALQPPLDLQLHLALPVFLAPHTWTHSHPTLDWTSWSCWLEASRQKDSLDIQASQGVYSAG